MVEIITSNEYLRQYPLPPVRIVHRYATVNETQTRSKAAQDRQDAR
jgi:hypothetical protein